MLGSEALALTALGLGVAYAATPGVVNTECLRRGIPGGFRPALAVAGGALRIGRIFGLANPAGIAFWAGVGGGTIATGAPAGDYARFLAAFLCGALAWSVALSLLASGGRRIASPGIFRTVDAIAGAILITRG